MARTTSGSRGSIGRIGVRSSRTRRVLCSVLIRRMTSSCLRLSDGGGLGLRPSNQETDRGPRRNAVGQAPRLRLLFAAPYHISGVA